MTEITQLQRTRQLARAFNKMDAAEAAYRKAQREFDTAYQPWAAATGAVTNRDEARCMLVSTGYLPKRKVWA